MQTSTVITDPSTKVIFGVLTKVPVLKITINKRNNVQNRISTLPKPVVQTVIPTISKKLINHNNLRAGCKQTSAERIQYLYTKAKRDCNMLKMRLKALRERYLQEKEETKRLQIYLQCHYKDFKINEMSEEYSKRNKLLTFSKDIEEEKDEEYEKLLRKIKKIKQDVSDNEILISEDCYD